MKSQRHATILEIIQKKNIETQENLTLELKKKGFHVTQATVSRDVRELKLTKTSIGNGRQKYSIAAEYDEEASQRFIRVFKETVLSMDYAQNILVIKTLTGMGMAVAVALDSMANMEILGTIAGDDTVFCVIRTPAQAMFLMERLNQLAKSGE